MADTRGDCSCLTGTPVFDMDGNCLCVEHVETPIIRSSPNPRLGNGRVVNVQPTPTTAAEDDDKIFGLPPLVVLGAAAVGLWFLSSSDKKEGKG